MSMLSKSLACLAVSGTLLTGAAWADTISPATYSTTLAVGGSTTINKTVTVAQNLTTAPVDIFFMADTTGSMGGAIGSVKAAAAGLLASTGVYGDVRWAVGDYKDIFDSYTYKLGTGFTSDSDIVTNAINAWGASGGGDTPEGQMYALTQAANDSGWRVGATHILVWFGDAPGHDPRNAATETSATAALIANKVVVEAINNGNLDGYGQATRIAAATGGNYFATSSGGVGTAIGTAISTAINTYTSVCLDTTGAPSGVSVTSSACINGTFDRTIERTFDFTVEFTGDTPGTYDFPIYATVDGGRVATERDRIVVSDGGTVPEPGMLLLMGAALGALGVTRRARKQ